MRAHAQNKRGVNGNLFEPSFPSLLLLFFPSGTCDDSNVIARWWGGGSHDTVDGEEKWRFYEGMEND